MDRKDSYKKSEDLEIDLISLIRSFCMKWKQTAVCALAGMILLGGYGYLKNRDTGVPEEIAAEETELTKKEQWSVAEAVQLKKENDGIEEYVENSILMQADAYHRKSVVLQYSIRGADARTLLKVMESYSAFLSYGQAAEAVQKTDKSFQKTDAVYLTELITVWQASDTQNRIVMDSSKDGDTEKILYVEVTGKDEKMAERLAEAMQKVLKEYTSSVKKTCGSHELTLLNEIERTRADSALLAQQREKREQLKTGRTNLQAMTDALNKAQKMSYEQETGTDSEEEAETAAGTGMGFLVKYIIFGLCAGVFAYGCVFVCLYLLRNVIRSENEFREYYNIPLYGSITAQKAAEKRKKPSDAGLGGDGYESRLAQTLGRIRLACKKQGIEKLCLAAEFSYGAKEQDILNRISEQLQDWGIHTVTGKAPDCDISQWDMLEETGTVLVACSVGETTYPMMDHAMEFYLENDIDVMGAVLLDGR